MRERRGELRLGDRRRERIELGIGEIAQIADRRRAVAREHIERIGKSAPPFLPGRSVLATALRSRSSAGLNAASGTANLRSRARVRKSVT